MYSASLSRFGRLGDHRRFVWRSYGARLGAQMCPKMSSRVVKWIPTWVPGWSKRGPRGVHEGGRRFSGPSWNLLGLHRSPCGPFMCPSWALLCVPETILALFWGGFAPSWSHLGAIVGCPGAFMDPLRASVMIERGIVNITKNHMFF